MLHFTLLNTVITPSSPLIIVVIYIQTNGTTRVAEDGVAFVNFPSQENYEDGFWSLVLPLLPLVMVVANSYPVLRTTKVIVLEKELKQKELLLIMGVR